MELLKKLFKAIYDILGMLLIMGFGVEIVMLNFHENQTISIISVAVVIIALMAATYTSVKPLSLNKNSFPISKSLTRAEIFIFKQSILMCLGSIVMGSVLLNHHMPWAIHMYKVSALFGILPILFVPGVRLFGIAVVAMRQNLGYHQHVKMGISKASVFVILILSMLSIGLASSVWYRLFTWMGIAIT